MVQIFKNAILSPPLTLRARSSVRNNLSLQSGGIRSGGPMGVQYKVNGQIISNQEIIGRKQPLSTKSEEPF